MSMGHSGIVFRVLCPKVSTGQEKLALTGLHGLHVFATLRSDDSIVNITGFGFSFKVSFEEIKHPQVKIFGMDSVC